MTTNRPPAPPFSYATRPRDLQTVIKDALVIESVLNRNAALESFLQNQNIVRVHCFYLVYY